MNTRKLSIAHVIGLIILFSALTSLLCILTGTVNGQTINVQLTDSLASSKYKVEWQVAVYKSIPVERSKVKASGSVRMLEQWSVDLVCQDSVFTDFGYAMDCYNRVLKKIPFTSMIQTQTHTIWARLKEIKQQEQTYLLWAIKPNEKFQDE